MWRRSLRIIGILSIVLMLLTGCKSRETDPGIVIAIEQDSLSAPSEVSEESTAPEEELPTTREVVLLGTKLSWFIPTEFRADYEDNGFVAFDYDSQMALAVRKESLKVLKPGFTDLSQLDDAICKSRLYDLLYSPAYNIESVSTKKIKIAGQEGFLALGYFVQGEERSCIQALCMQFDTDLIMAVGVSDVVGEAALYEIMESITASKTINTIWLE